MHRRQVLAALVTVAVAGCSDTATDGDTPTSSPTSSPTPSPTPTATPSPTERATAAAQSTLEDGNFVSGVREIDTIDQADSDAVMLEARYDLRRTSSTAEHAEFRAARTAKQVCEAVLEAGITPEDVARIATYAYIQTSDGDATVSTKLVVATESIVDTDWSDMPYQELVQRADQYTFNEYLFE